MMFRIAKRSVQITLNLTCMWEENYLIKLYLSEVKPAHAEARVIFSSDKPTAENQAGRRQFDRCYTAESATTVVALLFD